MTIPFKDDFTDTFGTPLEDHAPSGPDAGVGWTLNGAAASVLVRTTGATPRNSTAATYTCDDQGSADQYAQATIHSTATNFYLACRLVDIDNFIGVRANDTGSSGIRFVCVIEGAVTVLATAQYSAGDLVSIECSGSDVTFKVNGAQVGSVFTDTNFTTETSQGLVTLGTSKTNGIFDNFEAGPLAAPSLDVTIAEKEMGEVIQRTPSSNNAVVSFSGAYLLSPPAIEIRILDAADSVTEIVGWTVIDASPTGGNWAGSITVPAQAKTYYAEVRRSDDIGTTAIQGQQWSVGVQVLFWGQSNHENMFTDGLGVPSPLLSINSTNTWAFKDASGAGAIAFGNKLITELGVPVALFHYAPGGTSLSLGANWGVDTADDTYDLAIQGAASGGNKAEVVVWWQGEADAANAATDADYQTALETLITTRMRGTINNGSALPNLPFFISELGRRTDSVDANTQAIKNAQKAVADGAIPDVYLGATTYDLPLFDTVHLTEAGYITYAGRLAQSVLDVIGTETYHRGQQISDAVLIDSTTVDVNLTPSGGTDFTPSSGITGFEVFDDAASLTISSAVRLDEDTVRLAVTPAINGVATFRYMYGANPDITGAIVDNSAAALPLETLGVATTVLAVSSTLIIGDADSGIPDGVFMTWLLDPSTDKVVFAGDVTYSGGEGSSDLPFAAGTEIKGAVFDGLSTPINGAPLHGITV